LFDKISGSKISSFFYCKYERNTRIPLKINNPQLFGKILEVGFSQFKNGESYEQIITLLINKIISANKHVSLNVDEFLSRLFHKIYALKSFNDSRLVEMNLLCEDNNFRVEIDQLLRLNSCFFPREIKSFKSPEIYVWNSDLMQLTTQCIVIENTFNIKSQYGELLYLGNDNLIPIDTYPFRKCVFYAQGRIFRGFNKIDCFSCKKLSIDRCNL